MDRRALPVGVEEEYQLCDAETGNLTPAVDAILDAADPELRQILGYELLHTVLEGSIARSIDVEANSMVGYAVLSRTSGPSMRA